MGYAIVGYFDLISDEKIIEFHPTKQLISYPLSYAQVFRGKKDEIITGFED